MQTHYQPIHDLRLTRKPRTGLALALSTLLVLAGILWTPQALLDLLFGAPRPPGTVAEREPDPHAHALRLIPAPPLPADPATAEAEPTPTRVRPTRRPRVEPDPSPRIDAPEGEAWTYDPTTTHLVLEELLAPLGPVAPDTVARRAELLRRLTLTDLRYLAPSDTTQVDLAWRQWREVDEYVNRVYGPLWNMQGFTKRLAELYERAFYEPEREGH